MKELTPPPVPDPAAARRYLLLVLAAIAVLSALLAREGLARAAAFGYASPDDAMLVQRLWNTLDGRPLAYTVESFEPPWARFYLGSHFDLSLLVLLPFFWLRPGHEVLLVLHPLLALLGAVPLYRLALRRLGRPGWAAAVAGLYLCYPLLDAYSTRAASYFLLAVPLLLLALERLDAGDLWTSCLCFGLALLNREELALPVAAFLLPLAVRDRERRPLAVVVSVAGLLWLGLYLGLLRGALGSGPDGWGRYAHLGSSGAEVLLSPALRPRAFFGSVLAPDALRLGLLLVLPLGPAALLAPRHLLAAAAPLALVGASQVASDRVLGHYLVPAIPFLFAGLVEGLARLSRWRRGPWSAAFVGLLTAALLTLAAWQVDGGPFVHYDRLRILDPRKLQALQRANPERAAVAALIATIPPEASVSASAPALVLVAARRALHPFPVRADAVDFVLVDTALDWPRWPETPHEAHLAAVARARAEPGVRVTEAGRWLLIDRRAAGAARESVRPAAR